MPRQPRLRIAGFPFHVIQRGSNRSPCFHCTRDYETYLEYLHNLSGKHGAAVHAYVLMTNHVHLLLTPADDDALGRVMKGLGQCYAQYANRAYKRTGPLWDGRFRSCLVDTETYLFTCYRYIESNPVRAGMVSDPGEYIWSSHRANALGTPDLLVTPHPCLQQLGATPDERRSAYRELFRQELPQGLVDEIRGATNGGFAIGSEAFKREMASRLGRRVARRRSKPEPTRRAGRPGEVV